MPSKAGKCSGEKPKFCSRNSESVSMSAPENVVVNSVPVDFRSERALNTKPGGDI